MKTLGETIKTLRKARNMTQEEFAGRVNVTKSTVSAYETGTRMPSYDVLVKIARLFHVPTDELLGCGGRQTIDVTGLTPRQRSQIQDVVTTYQRYNSLYRAARERGTLPESLGDSAHWGQEEEG